MHGVHQAAAVISVLPTLNGAVPWAIQCSSILLTIYRTTESVLWPMLLRVLWPA